MRVGCFQMAPFPFHSPPPMSDQLSGKTIALLLAPVGTERVEFEKPKAALEDALAAAVVVGLERGEGQTMDGDTD